MERDFCRGGGSFLGLLRSCKNNTAVPMTLRAACCRINITDNTHTLRLFSPHLLRLTAGFIPLLPAVERTHTHGPVPKKSGFWRLLVVKGGNTDKRTSLKRPAGNGKGKSTCCGKMQETHPGGGAVEGEAPIPERLRIRCEEGNAETEQHGN